MHAGQIGDADQLFLVGVRDHRGLVEDQNMVLQRCLRLCMASAIRRLVDQPAPVLQEASQRLRSNARVALKHLDERVLHREPDNRMAFLAQHFSHGCQHARLARASHTLDGDRAISRGKDEPRGAKLPLVELEAVIDFGRSLNAAFSFVTRNSGLDRVSAFGRPGKDARLDFNRLAAGDPASVLARPLQKMA